MIALELELRNHEMISMLVSAGANMDLEDLEGHCPLVETLFKFWWLNGRHLDILEILGVDARLREQIIQSAARLGQTDAVKMILENIGQMYGVQKFIPAIPGVHLIRE